MNDPYVIRYNKPSDRWHVRGRSYGTLQSAIEWAKSSAQANKSEVIWFDREGNVQGRVSYRTPILQFGHSLVDLWNTLLDSLKVKH